MPSFTTTDNQYGSKLFADFDLNHYGSTIFFQTLTISVNNKVSVLTKSETNCTFVYKTKNHTFQHLHTPHTHTHNHHQIDDSHLGKEQCFFLLFFVIVTEELLNYVIQFNEDRQKREGGKERKKREFCVILISR